MKPNPRADDEAKLAYALTVGLSFDDGLKMVREMFKVDDLDACELIARGSLLAKQMESASGRAVRARQSGASSASGFVKTNPSARACQGRALMED